MDTEHYAQSLAARLPGGRGANLQALMALRGRRILKLQRAGLSRAEIQEATGWTERQQRYALRRLSYAP